MRVARFAGYQCDNSDFDFRIAEHSELPVIEICSDEGRDDCQQLKPKGAEASFGTTVITATILFIISILFSRVTVNELFFVLRVYVFSSVCCDAVHVRCCDFALSASFVLECFDGSEVTTREGNELVVQKENCVVEEIKEAELRSRRGKFSYNRTYNFVGLNQVSQLYFRHDRLP